MTENDKADELINSFWNLDDEMGHHVACNASVLFVDGLIKELNSLEFGYDIDLSSTINYWKRVKDIIDMQA